MVSKTLQELADFFGCYFFVQPNGMVFTSKNEPLMFKDGDGTCLQWTYGAEHEVNAFCGNCISISDLKSHDWKVVVKPRVLVDEVPRFGI